jgi:transmembrane sensor
MDDMNDRGGEDGVNGRAGSPGRVGSPAVRTLVQRCLDGIASEAEVAELDRLVAADATVARELARTATLESSLEVLLRAQDGETPARLPTAADVTDLAAWRGRRAVRMVAAAGGLAAIAAAFLLAGPLRPGRSRDGAIATSEGRTRGEPPIAAATEPAAPPQGVKVTTPGTDAVPVPASPRQTPSSQAPLRRLRFADGSSAELRDDSSRLETRVSKPRAIDLVLVQGEARFEVAHVPGRRFRIWVAGAYVQVVGTVFSVERLAASVRVSVERGIVKVVSGPKAVYLARGEEQILPLEGAEDRRLARSRSRQPPGATEKSTEIQAVDEGSTLLEASEDARRQGRPADAFVLLQRFLDRHGRDSRAFYVTFIEGRVLLEELARPREAAAAFARVEALNPRTPLVQDALAREVEAWCRAGDTEMARQRARAFLRRYPNGQRTDEVRRYGQLE